MERNPGPTNEKTKIDCGFCQSKIIEEANKHLTCRGWGLHSHKQKKCSDTTRYQLEKMDLSEWVCKECRDKEEGPQHEQTDKECKECKLPLKSIHVRCAKCEKYCHMQRACSGVSRDHLKKINLSRWLCQECKDPEGYNRRARQDNHQEEEKAKCSICKGIIKAGSRRLNCSRCKKNIHLQIKCSGETKEATKKGGMNISKWICLTCTEEEAERSAKKNRTENPRDEIEIITEWKKEKSSIRIMQWNADSFAAKKEEFKQVILESKIDIFMIQESKMTRQDRIPNIPGYTVLSKPRKQAIGKEKNRGGGLLTGIKNTIPYREIKNFDVRDTDDGITEWQMIEIPIGNEKLKITNFYIPSERAGDCRGSTKDTVVSTKYWPREPYDLLLGDFNAHAATWDNTTDKDDDRGKSIDRWMDNNSMVPLNTGVGTHINRKTGKESAPDISIVKSGEEDKYEWEVLKKLGASDHYPVVITRVPENIQRVNMNSKYKWDLKNANWEEFREKVENELPTTYMKKSTHKLEKIMRKTITSAAEKHIGRKKNTINGKPGYSKQVKEAIEERNRLKGRVREPGGRTRWRDKCREVKKVIKEEKAESWKEYVEGMDTKTNTKQVWRTIRNLDGRISQRKENEMLVIDGKGYTADSDKAKQFAKTYKKVSKIPRGPRDKITKRQNRKFLNNKPTEQRKYEEEITWEELARAVKIAKREKAAGEDTIPYELIKELGTKAQNFILHLFNEIWRGKPIPQRWRVAVILPILKDGKDPALPSSYRPISLTDCLGKLLERVIAERLSAYMEENHLFNECQAGFRKERSTTDQVVKLVQLATDRMQNTDGEVATLVTFFDFERAYDKVWREGLISKMIKLNVPYNFIKYTRLFLSARKTMVEINGVRSKEFVLNEGLPQGSAISPLMFLLFINDITEYLPKNASPSLFADDTAASVECGKDKEQAEQNMQKNIDGIKKWADDWKMRLNTGKTQVMVISTKDSDIAWKPKLHLEGVELEVVKEYKFLGVTIDGGLRFEKHLENVVAKAKRRIKILRCLAGKDWGQDLETQRALYSTYIRSALEYAAPGWYPWIGKTARQKLETIQNECLRIMTRMARDSPADFLRLEAGVEPLETRINKICQILWEKYTRLEEEDPRRKLTVKSVKQRLSTRYGWRHKTAPQMNKTMNRDTPRTTTNPMMSMKAKIDHVELKRNKDQYTLAELAKETELKIAEIDADVEIFTDGSTSGDQQKGGAGVFVQDRNGNTLHEEFKAAGRICSSYDGECVAMLLALEWIEAREEPDMRYAVFTDSKSLVSSLEARNWKDQHEWLKAIKIKLDRMKKKLTICWIPSHCNTYGNDRADALADKGAKCEQKDAPVTYNIAKAKIKNSKWQFEHDRAGEIYGERRKPKEAEKKWPMKIRSMFSRLRCDHATELKSYRKRIKLDQEDKCIHCDMDAVDNIKHILCECPQLEEKRRRLHPERFTVQMLTTHPEVCRKLLATRFEKLRDDRKEVEDEGGGSPADCTGPQA